MAKNSALRAAAAWDKVTELYAVGLDDAPDLRAYRGGFRNECPAHCENGDIYDAAEDAWSECKTCNGAGVVDISGNPIQPPAGSASQAG